MPSVTRQLLLHHLAYDYHLPLVRWLFYLQVSCLYSNQERGKGHKVRRHMPTELVPLEGHPTMPSYIAY